MTYKPTIGNLPEDFECERSFDEDQFQDITEMEEKSTITIWAEQYKVLAAEFFSAVNESDKIARYIRSKSTIISYASVGGVTIPQSDLDAIKEAKSLLAIAERNVADIGGKIGECGFCY